MGVVNKLRALGRDQRGLSTVEYTLLLVLILAGSVKLWTELGSDVYTKLSNSKANYAKAGDGSGPPPKSK